MNRLPVTDSHHLNAAIGWLELGNHAEANRELDAITPVLRIHPDVLEVRWHICAEKKMWIAAFEIASAICELDPERLFGWVQQAYALNEQDRTSKACEVLESVIDKFPKLPIIPYSLACYNCRLNRPVEAWSWLEKAMARGNSDTITRLALKEPDLKMFWSRLRISTANRTAVLPSVPAQRVRAGVKKSVAGGRLQKVLRGKSSRRFRFIS
jgi:predicted Zn-dependent protease